MVSEGKSIAQQPPWGSQGQSEQRGDMTQSSNPLIHSRELHHSSWADFSQIHNFYLITEPIRVKAQDTTAGFPQNAKVMRDKDGAFTGVRRQGKGETSMKWGITKEKNAFSVEWHKARDSVVTYW